MRRGVPIVIRSGSGVGDSIYLQSVVRYFLDRGDRVEARTNYPDIFRPLRRGTLMLRPFNKHGCTKVAHYTNRKHHKETTQFEDCCRNAGITDPVDLRLDWSVSPLSPIASRVRQSGKPVVCVGLPREPMARTDGFGKELKPEWSRIQRIIDELSGSVCFVQIGKGVPLYTYTGINLDLANRTTVAGLLDAAAAADGFLGYCSFLVPLAESLSRPGLFVWSRRGLNSGDRFISAIAPQKVLHRKSSRAVVDDASDKEISAAASAFYSEIGCRQAA